MTNFSQVGERFKTIVRDFHRDEDGLQAIETVVLLAVAALVMVGINWIWTSGGNETDAVGGGGLRGKIVGTVWNIFTLNFGGNSN